MLGGHLRRLSCRWRWRRNGCGRRRWGQLCPGGRSSCAGLWRGLRRCRGRRLRLRLGAGRSGRRGRCRWVRSGNGQRCWGRRWVRGPIDRHRLPPARFCKHDQANAQADQGQGHQGHGHGPDYGREQAQRPSAAWIVGWRDARIDQPPISFCSEDTPAALPPSTGEERIFRAHGDSRGLDRAKDAEVRAHWVAGVGKLRPEGFGGEA